MRTSGTLRPLFVAGLVLLSILGAGLSFSQTPGGHSGRMMVEVPDPTQAGNWDGTWYYESTGMKMVLWMRTQKAKPEVKLRYDSGQRPLSFETDWNGDATYYVAERSASFKLHTTKADANQIEGTWFWETPLGSTVRTEKGTFTIFRTNDGRMLVFKFDDYDLTTMHEGKPYSSSLAPVWTFIKASKRLALWDELPF